MAEDGNKTAVVRGLLDRERDAVLARGSTGALFDAYREHARAWEILPDELAQEMMRQGLAVVALHLALKPPDQFNAWTLNIHEPAMNFFLAGDNNAFHITGRVFTQDVHTVGKSRLFVESQRSKRAPSQSVIDVEGLDVCRIFEQYYNLSEQIPSRLFEVAPDDFVLVQGLPRVDRGWLDAVDEDGIRAYTERGLEPIEERTYTFQCGCDPVRILQVIRKIYARRVDDLFLGDDKVEVLCPRCGRKWWLARDDYERGPGGVGLS